MTEPEKKAAEAKVLSADERAQLRILLGKLTSACIDVEYFSTQIAAKVAPQFRGFFLEVAEKQKQTREQIALQKSEVAP